MIDPDDPPEMECFKIPSAISREIRRRKEWLPPRRPSKRLGRGLVFAVFTELVVRSGDELACVVTLDELAVGAGYDDKNSIRHAMECLAETPHFRITPAGPDRYEVVCLWHYKSEEANYRDADGDEVAR